MGSPPDQRAGDDALQNDGHVEVDLLVDIWVAVVLPENRKGAGEDDDLNEGRGGRGPDGELLYEAGFGSKSLELGCYGGSTSTTAKPS